MNLIECLSEIKDPRIKEGQRYSSVSMLLVVIMSMLCNKFCYREIASFGKLNEQFLVKYLESRNGRTPSHVSVRSFILSTDFASRCRAREEVRETYLYFRIDNLDNGWQSIQRLIFVRLKVIMAGNECNTESYY